MNAGQRMKFICLSCYSCSHSFYACFVIRTTKIKKNTSTGNAHRISLFKATNTKSLAKEFSKILIFEYFRYFRIGFDVFFDADSESPRMT